MTTDAFISPILDGVHLFTDRASGFGLGAARERTALPGHPEFPDPAQLACRAVHRGCARRPSPRRRRAVDPIARLIEVLLALAPAARSFNSANTLNP